MVLSFFSPVQLTPLSVIIRPALKNMPLELNRIRHVQYFPEGPHFGLTVLAESEHMKVEIKLKDINDNKIEKT